MSAPACPPPREPSRPKVPPPPGACDTHAHVFGPASRFPYAEDRSYTPPDAPLEKYLAMLDTVGFSRGVLVQGSAHGRDNAAMLDAVLGMLETRACGARSRKSPSSRSSPSSQSFCCWSCGSIPCCCRHSSIHLSRLKSHPRRFPAALARSG